MIEFDPANTYLGTHLTGDDFNFMLTAEVAANTVGKVTEVELTTTIIDPRGTVTFSPPLLGDVNEDDYFLVGLDESGTVLGFQTVYESVGNKKIARIYGFYTIGIFPNYRTGWVEPGTADVSRVTGDPNRVVPAGKDLTDVRPDPTGQYRIIYTISAKTNTGLEASKQYEHVVLQNYSEVKTFIKNYLGINRIDTEITAVLDDRLRAGDFQAGSQLGVVDG